MANQATNPLGFSERPKLKIAHPEPIPATLRELTGFDLGLKRIDSSLRQSLGTTVHRLSSNQLFVFESPNSPAERLVGMNSMGQVKVVYQRLVRATIIRALNPDMIGPAEVEDAKLLLAQFKTKEFFEDLDEGEEPSIVAIYPRVGVLLDEHINLEEA